VVTVLKTGIILLLASLGMWFYEHEFEHTLPFNSDLDIWAATLGSLLIAVYLLAAIYVILIGGSAKWARKSRCVRCGIKIPKNDMYCEFHKAEIAEEFLRGSADRNSSSK